MYICDTNFILRYLLADNEAQFQQNKELFEKVKTGQIKVLLENYVLTEVIFVLSSFYKVPRTEIKHILAQLLTYKGLLSDAPVLIPALEHYATTNLHIVDCLLLSKSKAQKLHLLSFDQQLMDIVKN